MSEMVERVAVCMVLLLAIGWLAYWAIKPAPFHSAGITAMQECEKLNDYPTKGVRWVALGQGICGIDEK